MLPTRIRPLAEAHIANVHNTYFGLASDKASKWLEAIDETLVSLETFPRSFSVLFDDVRMAYISNFPYHLLYSIEFVEDEEYVLILACVHERSDRTYWPKYR
jgi:plasmid stabilization system protein ParE